MINNNFLHISVLPITYYTENANLHRRASYLYSADHRSVGVDNMAVYKSLRTVQNFIRLYDGVYLYDTVGQLYNLPQRLDVQAQKHFSRYRICAR